VLAAEPVLTAASGTSMLSSEGARRLLGLLDACMERIARDAASERWAGGRHDA
jgi:hypothetical protein